MGSPTGFARGAGPRRAIELFDGLCLRKAQVTPLPRLGGQAAHARNHTQVEGRKIQLQYYEGPPNFPARKFSTIWPTTSSEVMAASICLMNWRSRPSISQAFSVST